MIPLLCLPPISLRAVSSTLLFLLAASSKISTARAGSSSGSSSSLDEGFQPEGIWTGWAPGFIEGSPLPNQKVTPNAQLPLTASEASSAGWTQQETDGPWLKTGGSAFALYFDDDGLEGFDVTGPAISIPVSVSVAGTVDNGDGTITYQFRFDDDYLSLGDIKIPFMSDDADEAGWNQGSCLESMGGTHYFKSALSFPGVVPIYNSYGDQRLNAVIANFGPPLCLFGDPPCNPPQPVNPGEFDLLGFPSPLSASCASTFCGDTDCNTAASSGVPFVTNVHIFFKDPSFNDGSFPIAECSSVAEPCWEKIGIDPTAFACDCPAPL